MELSASCKEKLIINQVFTNQVEHFEARDLVQPFPRAINAPLETLASHHSLIEFVAKPSLHNLEHS